MLFKDGSVMVAVVSRFESGDPATYFADPVFPAGVVPDPPVSVAAAAVDVFDPVEHPAIRIAIVATIVKHCLHFFMMHLVFCDFLIWVIHFPHTSYRIGLLPVTRHFN
jgi:hypothetical protein